MNFLLSALGWLNPKRLLYIAGAALLAFVVWQGANFIDAKYEAEARVVQLEADVKSRDEAIKILKVAAAQRASAQQTADAAQAEVEAQNDVIDEIRRKAAAASADQNGDLAPVLRDALMEIDGVKE